MHIDIDERSGITIIHVHGELTGGEEASLLGPISDLLDHGVTNIVIDLADVPFMNSDGLGELVRAGGQINMAEKRMVLAQVSAFVEGVLQATNLNRFFDIYPSVDDAIAALRG